jgi:hypothetical protein
MDMKKILTPLLLIAVIAGLMLNSGCKQDENQTIYRLIVTLGAGASGTPVSGSYNYIAGETIDFSYNLSDGYDTLIVKLDDEEVEASGQITMNGNHTLEAYGSSGSGEYLVYVALGTGVEGEPEGGYYRRDAGAEIPYNFSLLDGYTNLTVTLDGTEVDNPGVLTVSDDHTLYVYAEVEYLIQGQWTLQEQYTEGSAFEVTLTFAGDVRNGTVFDSDGGTGTYEVDGDDVTIHIYYPDVTYEYTGTFSDKETMSGDSKRYTSETEYSKGVWQAVKNTEGESVKLNTSRKGVK